MGINIGLDIGIASVGLAVVDSDTGNTHSGGDIV